MLRSTVFITNRFTGMLCAANSEWTQASMAFMIASMFRSNGFILSGYVLWGMVISPFLDKKRVSCSTIHHCIYLTLAVDLTDPGGVGNLSYRVRLLSIRAAPTPRSANVLSRCSIVTSAPMVFEHTSVHLQLRPRKVLERRIPALLDTISSTEHSARRTCTPAALRLLHPASLPCQRPRGQMPGPRSSKCSPRTCFSRFSARRRRLFR